MKRRRSKLERLIREHRLREWRSAAEDETIEAAEQERERRVAAAAPPAFVDLSPAEVAFRALLADRHAYAEWAAGVRLAWERENVLWLQGWSEGQPVYTVSRSPADSEQRFVRRRGH